MEEDYEVEGEGSASESEGESDGEDSVVDEQEIEAEVEADNTVENDDLVEIKEELTEKTNIESLSIVENKQIEIQVKPKKKKKKKRYRLRVVFGSCIDGSAMQAAFYALLYSRRF